MATMVSDVQLSIRVAQRFLLSDDRYRPPRQILMGVDSGDLDPRVLLIWKYVVEKLGPKFNYGAGTVYWRNKCVKEGLNVGPEFMKAGEGATFGHFKIKTGDQIEDWVKERLKTAGLVSDTHKTAAEWQFEITSLETALQDAQQRITKHEKGIEEGSRVNQRVKWLAEAKRDLEKASKDLEAARKAVSDLQETVEQHTEVEAPVIDFEKQFYSALSLATNDLSKREVLARAKAALAKFEAEMATPKMASDRSAGILDTMWEGAKRLWNSVLSAFAMLKDWVSDLVSSTKQIEKVLAAVK